MQDHLSVEWCGVEEQWRQHRIALARANTMMRPKIVLFGDSITEQSIRENGWGVPLANAYSRRVTFLLSQTLSRQIRFLKLLIYVTVNDLHFQADVLVRGYGGYNTRWAMFLLNHLFPLVSYSHLNHVSSCWCVHIFPFLTSFDLFFMLTLYLIMKITKWYLKLCLSHYTKFV